MISRAPKVPWESIYLPFVESITYALASTGSGTLQMRDGRFFPWSRMASWLCTCPVMLGQISNMALVKYKSIPLNPIAQAASIIRVVMGITATIAPAEYMKWLFFFFGATCLVFEYSVVFTIFQVGLYGFESVGTPLAQKVVVRIKMLRLIFFVAWTMFPIIWLISPTGVCVIHENVSAILYLLADGLCKNTYGVILWSTAWGVLEGKWDPACLPGQEKPEADDPFGLNHEKNAPPNDEVNIRMFGRVIGSVRKSKRRQKWELAPAHLEDRIRLSDEEEDDSRPKRKKKGDARDYRRKHRGGSDDDHHSSDSESEKKNKGRKKKSGKGKKKDDSGSEDDLEVGNGKAKNGDKQEFNDINKILRAMKRNAGTMSEKSHSDDSEGKRESADHSMC